MLEALLSGERGRAAREALIAIRGVPVLAADVIIAGTGADVSVFAIPAHLIVEYAHQR